MRTGLSQVNVLDVYNSPLACHVHVMVTFCGFLERAITLVSLTEQNPVMQFWLC